MIITLLITASRVTIVTLWCLAKLSLCCDNVMKILRNIRLVPWRTVVSLVSRPVPLICSIRAAVWLSKLRTLVTSYLLWKVRTLFLTCRTFPPNALTCLRTSTAFVVDMLTSVIELTRLVTRRPRTALSVNRTILTWCPTRLPRIMPIVLAIKLIVRRLMETGPYVDVVTWVNVSALRKRVITLSFGFDGLTSRVLCWTSPFVLSNGPRWLGMMNRQTALLMSVTPSS